MKRRISTTVVLLILCCGSALAADPANFTLKQTGKGVYAAVAVEGGKAGSNAGFIIGDNGVVVVDTFVNPVVAQELLAEIRKLTNLPIRYVVNTHYHLDHTSGNGVFAEAGATIVAQRNLRTWLRSQNLKFFGANPTPEQKARVEALVLPDLVYTDAVDLYLGSRLVQVRFMLGHTGGDSVVTVPDANVVFAGDLMWTTHLPNLIDASTEPWMQTLDKLLAEHPSATFVAGHGDIATADNVRDFRGYLATLRQDVAQAQTEGKSGQALLDTVQPELQAKYGAWGFFKNFAQRNIDQTAAELSGQKKIPVPGQP